MAGQLRELSGRVWRAGQSDSGSTGASGDSGAARTPAAGVVVSTDQAVAVTDAEGRYRLPRTERDRFVKLTTPRGERADGDWYFDLDPAPARAEYDFVLTPEPTRAQDDFLFLQITDLHLREGRRIDAQTLRADLAALMAEWQGRAAFLAVTGDLTDRSGESDMTACQAALDALPLPAFCVPGNHDYLGDPEGSHYRRAFGPGSYSFDWGGVHFVAYDTITDRPGAAQRHWLRADLAARPAGSPVILLTHYPLGDEFYDLWRGGGLVATISGHWHSSRLYVDGATVHYNAPSFSFGGIDYSPRGYRVFRWRDGQLSAETRTLAAPRDEPAGAPVAAAVLLGASPVRPREWPQVLGGPDRCNVAPAPVAPAATLHWAWRRPLPGRVQLAAPVVHRARILVPTLDEDSPRGGQVVALDAATGRELWRRPVGDSVKNGLACGDGRVIGATVSGELFCLDTATGAELWRRPLGDRSQRWVYAAPLLANGRVYAGASGWFGCLDAATGEALWERTDLAASDWISSPAAPAFWRDRVIMGFLWQPNGLCALAAETGESLWVHQGKGGESAVSTAAVSGDHIYVLRHRGVLQKLVAADGSVVWEREGFAGWSPAAPVPTERAVFAVSGDGRVSALDPVSGEELWNWRIEAPALFDTLPYHRRTPAVLAAPLITGERVWIAGADGTLVALAAADGSVVQRETIGAPLLSSPVPLENGLLLVDATGMVHAATTG